MLAELAFIKHKTEEEKCNVVLINKTAQIIVCFRDVLALNSIVSLTGHHLLQVPLSWQNCFPVELFNADERRHGVPQP